MKSSENDWEQVVGKVETLELVAHPDSLNGLRGMLGVQDDLTPRSARGFAVLADRLEALYALGAVLEERENRREASHLNSDGCLEAFGEAAALRLLDALMPVV